jgi:hypothetical protein
MRNLPNAEQTAIFEEFIKNYLYKAESVLKINEVVWEWFTNARSKNVHISSPMVLNEALAVAKSLGNYQFRVTTGWLDSFKMKLNIVWKGVCGESKDVVESVVSINQNC